MNKPKKCSKCECDFELDNGGETNMITMASTWGTETKLDGMMFLCEECYEEITDLFYDWLTK